MIKNWDGVHPVSNSRVIGSVVILVESNNINFDTTPIQGNEVNRDAPTVRSEYHESEEFEGEDF